MKTIAVVLFLLISGCASQHAPTKNAHCLSYKESIKTLPEYAQNELRTMQSTEGKKQFAAFSAVAASLERKTSVSSSYILENSEFETLVGGKYTNMLSIKRALLAAGVPNVSGYLIQDPYIPLHSQQSVAISVIGPIIDKQNSGKPYLANQFYISYRYSEKEVNIISIGGKVCSLPPQEFSMLGTEKPFLILGQPPNNSFKADAQSARP